MFYGVPWFEEGILGTIASPSPSCSSDTGPCESGVPFQAAGVPSCPPGTRAPFTAPHIHQSPAEAFPALRCEIHPVLTVGNVSAGRELRKSWTENGASSLIHREQVYGPPASSSLLLAQRPAPYYLGPF